MLCFFAGLAVNLALKIGLYRTYGVVGLASATAVGAWINFALLILLGVRRDWMRPDAKLIENIAITTFCTGGAAIVATHLFHAVDFFVRRLHFMRNELDIVLTGAIAIVIYLMIYKAASLIFGRSLRRQLL
jgi:putative peptidoglycan lipid II flippase